VKGGWYNSNQKQSGVYNLFQLIFSLVVLNLVEIQTEAERILVRVRERRKKCFILHASTNIFHDNYLDRTTTPSLFFSFITGLFFILKIFKKINYFQIFSNHFKILM